MAKKERLGSDPFKESSLNWIKDTREEKKDSKEPKAQKAKEPKPQSAKTLKRFDVKELKRQNVKTSKSLNVLTSDKGKIKKVEPKKRHTIYLSSSQSKKLKIYAAENNMKLSEIIEKLISEKIWRFGVMTSKRQRALALKRQNVLMFTYILMDGRRKNAFRS